MPNVSNFGTQTDNAVVQGTVTDRAMVIPDVPPQGLMSVGPRVTPHFVKPSLWSALTTYHFFDAVHDAAGASYVATKPDVPAGTELTNEDYWFLWADPNSQFADLSELVKTYNGRIAKNTADIATKAPNNHASEDTTYGVGNDANYGHVRLATGDTPLTSDSNAGIAATPKMVNDIFKNKDVVYLSEFNSIADAIDNAVQNDKVLIASVINTAETIDIPSNLTFICDKIVYTGSESAISLDSVANTCVFIRSIVSDGKGISFDCKTKNCERNNISFNEIVSMDECIYIYTRATGSFGVMDNTIEGQYVESKTKNCVHVDTNSGWVGQCKIYVNRIQSNVGNAVYLFTDNSGITSLDFGYTSFENSMNGISFEATANKAARFEGVYGNIRAREVQKTRLKYKGSINKNTVPINLTFDAISNTNTDVSEITQDDYSYGYIIINGCILDSTYNIITNQAIICSNKGLAPIDNTVAQTITVSADYSDNTLCQYYYVSQTCKFKIPNWLSAVSNPIHLEVVRGVNVTIVNQNDALVATIDASSVSKFVTIKRQYSGVNSYLIYEANALVIRG